ncbi:MAG: type IX secretion system outer membrane channel protein PorV [Cyclobacteriaceae bacterium]
MSMFKNGVLVIAVFSLSFGHLFAQRNNAPVIAGQDDDQRPITTAVPFITFAPDARGASLGDAGVATSPDIGSIHWNNAKLAFIDNDYGFSVSYTPWLGKIVNDMFVSYLSGYKRIDKLQTVGVSLRYFDLGDVFLTNELGIDQGSFNPREWAIDATYSRKLNNNLSLGLTTRFISSNLSGPLSNTADSKTGTSVAVDLGVFYTKDILLSGKNATVAFGGHISNFGSKVTYSSTSNEDFIPTNLRLGTALKMNVDPYNSFTFVFDMNKLMVPTPPVTEQDDDGNIVVVAGRDPDGLSLLSGVFGSFGDAPGGFSEEMKELTFSTGAEYWYKDIAAFRAGYFNEHRDKGNRKFITFGLGFRYQVFGVDFAYLIPTEQNHPLAETLRLTLLFNFLKPETSNTDLDNL